jgi:nicotinate-nucleotide adenylyltransferase
MKFKPTDKIAVYGGTFDPIHVGHILTAYDIIEKLEYDYVLFVPDNIPVHKNASRSDSYDRYEMVKMSVKGIKGFLCSDMEIKRGGYSYTYDTVVELKASIGYENKFGIIFGDDLLAGINSWKNIDKLQDMCDLICLRRYNAYNIQSDMKIKYFENRIMEISSTEIRQRLEKGLSVKGMIMDRAITFIEKKKLYGKQNGDL